MRIIRDIATYQDQKPSVITLGTFDGLHVGHRAVLEELVAETRRRAYQSVLITFHPHPQLVLHPDRIPELRILTTTDEKLEVISNCGIDVCYVLPFTKEVADQTGEQFVRDLLITRFHMRCCILGYDHAFGKDRSAHLETLEVLGSELGFDVKQVARVSPDPGKVSSSVIRRALDAGDIRLANRYLGRRYSLTGTVVAGEMRGRQLGFPTANIRVSDSLKLIPRDGVYAGCIHVGDSVHDAVINIGHRPTFGTNGRSVEAHVLQWSGDLYGLEVKLTFLERLRDERKFGSPEDLRQAIQKDIQTALSSVFTST